MNIQGQFVSTSFAARFLHDARPAEKYVTVEGDHLVCDIVTPDGKDAEFYVVPTPVEGLPHEELMESWRRFFA